MVDENEFYDDYSQSYISETNSEANTIQSDYTPSIFEEEEEDHHDEEAVIPDVEWDTFVQHELQHGGHVEPPT